MQSKVIKIDTIQHIYDIERCAGCSVPITGEYVELGLPSPDGSTLKHIALCESCGGIAENEGVL